MQHWLMKSEPDTFSIDDLKRKDQSLWDGVRNYQARNFMQHEMRSGDLILFYHSNTTPPGVAGLARVAGAAEPDPSQFKKSSDYFDPKATRDKPIWFCVPVAFETKFDRVITLAELRDEPNLKSMLLLRKGQRLSVQPVTAREFKSILGLAQK